MKKINFKQGKFIFPLVLLVPLVGLVYCIGGLFGETKEEEKPTDYINANLPEAEIKEDKNKFDAMTRRYGKEDESWTAISGLAPERIEIESVEQVYSEAQIDSIIAETERQIREQKEYEEYERRIREGSKRFSSPELSEAAEQDEYYMQLAQIKAEQQRRQEDIRKMLGLDDSPKEEAKPDTVIKQEEPKPNLVVKSNGSNAEKFNTVGGKNDDWDSPLIRAMIDQTTKAREGTRLRFKLLDDVEVKGTIIPKGTYLYGTVSGFGQQRVKANITSIMVGSKFIKIDLSVFDNDGMEGFYVPASDFRDFMKDASSSAMQTNINMNSGGYGSGVSGEALALQALQNIYSSATGAISNNIRRNKAKIKYNTIVYLINKEDAQ